MSAYTNMDQLLWPQGKKKAVTLSYDDGMEQDIRFVEMLRQKKVKATFCLNPGGFGDQMRAQSFGRWVDYNKLTGDQVIELYRDQDVAAHGFRHSFLDDRDTGRICYEILRSREELEELFQRPVTGYAYAYGHDTEDAAAAATQCGITYARTTRATHSFRLPKDFLHWDPTCHHNDEQLFPLVDEFLNQAFSTADPPARLLFVWGHSHEFDAHDNWQRMEELLDRIAFQKDVWYASNTEIWRYVTAVRRAVFSADGKYVYNPSAETIWLGNSLHNGCIEVAPGDTLCTLTF